MLAFSVVLLAGTTNDAVILNVIIQYPVKFYRHLEKCAASIFRIGEGVVGLPITLVHWNSVPYRWQNHPANRLATYSYKLRPHW
jgi:hypothetical protein